MYSNLPLFHNDYCSNCTMTHCEYFMFREEKTLVDVFAYEMLVVFVESLALAHSDDKSLGEITFNVAVVKSPIATGDFRDFNRTFLLGLDSSIIQATYMYMVDRGQGQIYTLSSHLLLLKTFTGFKSFSF